jgi:hypothetical protein
MVGDAFLPPSDAFRPQKRVHKLFIIILYLIMVLIIQNIENIQSYALITAHNILKHRWND